MLLPPDELTTNAKCAVMETADCDVMATADCDVMVTADCLAAECLAALLTATAFADLKTGSAGCDVLRRLPRRCDGWLCQVEQLMRLAVAASVTNVIAPAAIWDAMTYEKAN